MKTSTKVLLGLGVLAGAGLVGTVFYLRRKGSVSGPLSAVEQTRDRFFRLAQRTEQYPDLFNRLDSNVITPFEVRVAASESHYSVLSNAELDELIAIEAAVAQHERALTAN